jgi:hypothetical protein
MRHFAAACALVMALHADVTRAAFTFSDIQYWVGAGTNQAALAIDWSQSSTSPPALVWGYRWSGTATGADMLTAVVRADDRLFGKFDGPQGSESTIYGLGYDANNDGQFAINDGTSFDAQGVAYSGPVDYGISADPADYYAEGWGHGFWHYGMASSDPYNGGQWLDSQLGMIGRKLSDGAWDSWTFQVSTIPPFTSYANNPQSAPSPAGDFNGDHHVDVNDYNVWVATFGSTAELAADGNHDDIVDAADYTVWRDHLSQSVGSASSEFCVAEPSTLLLAICSLCALWLIRGFARKVGV